MDEFGLGNYCVPVKVEESHDLKKNYFMICTSHCGQQAGVSATAHRRVLQFQFPIYKAC